MKYWPETDSEWNRTVAPCCGCSKCWHSLGESYHSFCMKHVPKNDGYGSLAYKLKLEFHKQMSIYTNRVLDGNTPDVNLGLDWNIMAKVAEEYFKPQKPTTPTEHEGK